MNAKVNISNRAGASFPVRRMDFEFAQVPRYWANYDAGLTHFMTALSALFPEGEQFFVNSTIIGATSLDQLKENIQAFDITLDEAVLKGIEDIHTQQPNPAP